LKTNVKAQAEKELYLHADRELPYGIVVDVMAAAQRAGITNVGMITDPLGASKASKKP
jgi:biopolymer transport protein TolR